MVVLTLKAKNDHLQKVATTRDPIKALAEFVWNSLDADATAVSVILIRNALGGLQSIQVQDNGTGISHSRAEHDFESLGESWKLRRRNTAVLSRAIHGKEGLGRLRFFSLAHEANWTSVYDDNGRRQKLTIQIDSTSLQTSNVSESISVDKDTPTGTTVELAPLKEKLDWLTSEEAQAEFNSTFAPYVLQYPNVRIVYDQQAVDPKVTIVNAFDVPKVALVCPTQTIRDLSIKIIEWKEGIGSRKVYFGGESGIVLGSQAANIAAPGFDFSIYAYSAFFQNIATANLLEFDGLNDPDFTRILQHIRDQATDYFRNRQSEKAGELIEELKIAGVYPYEGEPRDDVERRERQVFDIATHAVSSYSREFKKADNPLKKITLRLLREAVSHNPESLTRILTAVFDLPKYRQDEFSSLLGKTELGNIISASTLVADRIVALKVLRQMVFDPKHRQTVRERGELDVLIRDNTWIFGENFHITMPEAGLTKIMERVSADLALNKLGRMKGRKPDGKIGRIDSFMGRVVPRGDRKHHEYLLLELKRPSKIVGRKELDQLEDYVTSILAQPDFLNTATTWNFYLVTTEYDDVVKGRITQRDRPVGVLQDGSNYTVWVKSWAELLRECEARLDFVQEKLRIEVSGEEIEQRISQLTTSILKGGRERKPKPTPEPTSEAESSPSP